MAEGMTPRERALREERQNAFETMKALMEKMPNGERLSVEDRAAFDAANDRISEIEKDLEVIKIYNQREAGREEAAETRGLSRDEADSIEKRYQKAWLDFFRTGKGGVTRLLDNGLDSGESRSEGSTLQALELELRTELDSGHGLSTAPGAPAAGALGYDAGYMIPQGFWHNLQIALKAYGGLLQHCRVIETPTGAPMPWPTQNPTAIVGSYITEQNQLGFGGDSNGTDYEFGQGILSAWTIVSGVILASIQVIQDSAFDVDGFVTDRMAEAIGRKIAAELHTGTGSSALLGIETALSTLGHQSAAGAGGLYLAGSSNNWASTTGGYAWQLYQAASSAGGLTSVIKLANSLIGFDDILGMIQTVDPAYRALGNCVFVANDKTFAMLRSITNGYGNPIWNPDVRPGGVDRVYGYELVIDQNTSNVSTSASTAGGLLFGDFTRAMVVRQVAGAHTQRLVERYADYLQVGFLSAVRMDARSNDLRAAALYSTNAA